MQNAELAAFLSFCILHSQFCIPLTLTGTRGDQFMRPYLLALLAGAALALPARAEQRFPDDAALHAVQFIDGDVGYAVGDDGVILKTINAGKSWELLPTRTR